MREPRHGEHVLVYDGSCGLCRRIVRWIQASRPIEPIRLVDYHDARALAPLPVDHDEADQSVILLTPDGVKRSGYEASVALLDLLPTYRRATPLMRALPIRPLGRLAYTLVTKHRHRLSKLTGLADTPSRKRLDPGSTRS